MKKPIQRRSKFLVDPSVSHIEDFVLPSPAKFFHIHHDIKCDGQSPLLVQFINRQNR
ncbi:MAG: hypothetical protein JWP09_461 [Candidatus Taylorbacteria bacterium]|nr:hypothetical protein [Candidatus Taylorbacteria bacterium]